MALHHKGDDKSSLDQSHLAVLMVDTAALGASPQCGYRRFGGMPPLWIPPLWGQALGVDTAALGGSLSGRRLFFGCEKNYVACTAALGLTSEEEFSGNCGNILIISERAAKVCKTLRNS